MHNQVLAMRSLPVEALDFLEEAITNSDGQSICVAFYAIKKMLKKEEFDPNSIKSTNGKSLIQLLMQAAIKHYDISRVLPTAVLKGVNINEPNELGDSLLIIAINSDQVKACQRLIKFGADPKFISSSNQTALEHAQGKGKVEEYIKCIAGESADLRGSELEDEGLQVAILKSVSIQENTMPDETANNKKNAILIDLLRTYRETRNIKNKEYFKAINFAVEHYRFQAAAMLIDELNKKKVYIYPENIHESMRFLTLCTDDQGPKLLEHLKNITLISICVQLRRFFDLPHEVILLIANAHLPRWLWHYKERSTKEILVKKCKRGAKKIKRRVTL